MKRPVCPWIASVVLLIVTGMVAGCSSGPDSRETATALETFSLETAKVNDTIDQAVSALKELVGSPGRDQQGLKAGYEAYAQSVAAVEAQAEVVKSRAEAMKAQGDEFFKDWEEGSGTGLSAERQSQLNLAYGKIKEQMALAADAFKPFLASLKDVQSLLSLDLSAGALQRAAPLVEKADTTAASVKTLVAGVVQQVNSVSGMLSRTPDA